MNMILTMQANLSSLPPEIIRHLCSFLSMQDIINLELTARDQRRLICESGVWRGVLLRWRNDLIVVLGEKMVKCRIVEEMADFLAMNELKELKYYKVASGRVLIHQ